MLQGLSMQVLGFGIVVIIVCFIAGLVSIVIMLVGVILVVSRPRGNAVMECL